MDSIKLSEIQNLIYTFRGVQVMIDRDLAELYQVQVKALNQAVKRNMVRFPESFYFQLSDCEKNELVTNCDRFEKIKHSSYNPYAFTEQGVSMLSAVLRSNIAVKVSITIINAFVEMRKFIATNASIFQRIGNIELKQLETDQKFEKIFKALESREIIPRQYGDLTVELFNKSHDRFLIIDNETVYHFDASLKDLGKKWFAFSKMDKDSVTIINSIQEFSVLHK